MLRPIIALAVFLSFGLAVEVCQACPLGKVLRAAKNVGGKVLRRASHPLRRS